MPAAALQRTSHPQATRCLPIPLHWIDQAQLGPHLTAVFFCRVLLDDAKLTLVHAFLCTVGDQHDREPLTVSMSQNQNARDYLGPQVEGEMTLSQHERLSQTMILPAPTVGCWMRPLQGH